jgi:uncharacterized protein YhbP (UPF0306 family)
MNEIEQLIRNYLPNIIHMSLATCVDNKPWVCEVHYAYDQELNLYFNSLPSRRHSQEITQNPYVSGNIVTQHGLGEKPQGIYFEGMAAMVEGPEEVETVLREYGGRFTDRADFTKAELSKDDGGRFYKITVSDFYVFDVRGELNPPGKHHLKWK